jgi:hypothetical protein
LNFEFSCQNKKKGGEDPLDPLFSAKGCIWKYNSDLDDDDKECSIFNGEDILMLRFSNNTKSSMLYKLVSVGKADLKASALKFT